jgi:ATP-dependent Clp protease adapter protein ClpS
VVVQKEIEETMKRLSIVVLSSCWVLLACNAFVSSPAFVRRANVVVVGVETAASSRLWAGLGKDKDSGGGAALAKPAVKIGQKTALVTETKQKVQTKRKVRTSDPVTRREEEFQEAPMFKLLLLDDAGYDPAHVVERLCAIVEDMDEDQAATVYQQAQQEGKAMVSSGSKRNANEMHNRHWRRHDQSCSSVMPCKPHSIVVLANSVASTPSKEQSFLKSSCFGRIP